MRLSVVIPAHDAEGTVAAAIASARAQTLPPDEVVVVDDGSTDGTASVAASCGATVVRQAQGGPSAARNAGVDASSGEWIAFLDADDEWHPDKLARQMPYAGVDGTVLVATDWSRALVAGPAPAEVPTSVLTSEQILLLNRFQTSTVLLERSAFYAAGSFDPSLDGVEDWDMWLRASCRGRVVKLDWPFVRYTDTASGYSKGLERVYRTGRTMLERRFGSTPSRHEREILAWHHLRFAVAFALDGDRGAARRCLVECHEHGLDAVAPSAAARYLVPFLARRVSRRLPFRRPAPAAEGAPPA